MVYKYTYVIVREMIYHKDSISTHVKYFVFLYRKNANRMGHDGYVESISKKNILWKSSNPTFIWANYSDQTADWSPNVVVIVRESPQIPIHSGKLA